jgi:cytochrome c2
VTIRSDDVLTKWRQLVAWVDVQHDPVYESPKRFLAIPITQLLVKIGYASTNFDLHVRCEDGFFALLSSTEALDGKGFLAIADEAFPTGSGFSPLKTKSGIIDPGPLYLFWLNDRGDRPRPYQIKEIEVCSSNDTLTRARPSRSNQAQLGFELFKKTCSACHAVNGAGGRVGVDLNIPMNVTEYWSRSALRRLLDDPQLVRANAKMPALHFSSQQVDDILAYLVDMRGRKMMK